MIVLVGFTLFALLVITLTMIANVLIFPRLKTAHSDTMPHVSILIPARNESAIIAHTLNALLNQTYPHYDITILDDHSEDDTASIAEAIAHQNERLRVIIGQPLPTGWMGKSWACHQLAQQATGDVLIFTDADVYWQPEALASLIAQMQTTQADLLSIWPTQTTLTWAERLTVPLIAMVILGYLPLVMVHRSPFAIFGAANGQCMAWQRSAYMRIGGHKAVANNVLEDVTLARLVKQAGLRLRMSDGNQFIGCRMYDGWPAVRDGFAKNILAGYGSAFALALATVFHITVFLSPYIWLLWAQWRPYALLAIALGMGLRALSAAFTHQRVLDSLLMPVSVLLMTRIALQAFWWHFTGGPRWKGRLIQQSTQGAHHG